MREYYLQLLFCDIHLNTPYHGSRYKDQIQIPQHKIEKLDKNFVCPFHPYPRIRGFSDNATIHRVANDTKRYYAPHNKPTTCMNTQRAMRTEKTQKQNCWRLFHTHQCNKKSDDDLQNQIFVAQDALPQFVWWFLFYFIPVKESQLNYREQQHIK